MLADVAGRRARPALRHPLDPRRDGRDVRPGRRRGPPLPGAAPRSGRSRSSTRCVHALGRDLSAEVVYCSRSGPPTQPWLEPDVNDRLEELAAAGRRGGRPRPGRVRLRPHGGRLRPRHRGRRDRRAPRTFGWSACPRSASTRPSSPASSTFSRSAPPRPGAGPVPTGTGRPALGVPRGLLPEPATGAARPSVGATDGDRTCPRGRDLAGLEELATRLAVGGRPADRRRTPASRRGVRDEVLAHRHRHDHGHPRGGAHPRTRCSRSAPTTAILGEEGDDQRGTSRHHVGRRPHRRHRQLPLRHPRVCGLGRRRGR